MQRVGGDDPLPGRVQHALLDHQARPAVPLLARLEHEHHAAAQQFAAPGEQPGRPDQRGSMQVVPAGMHRARHRGGVRQAGVLLDGQRVQVGAQQHRRARPGAAQHGGDGGQPLAEGDLQREAVQRGEDPGLGARQFESDLGVAMQIPPEGDQFGPERGGRAAQPVEGGVGFGPGVDVGRHGAPPGWAGADGPSHPLPGTAFRARTRPDQAAAAGSGAGAASSAAAIDRASAAGAALPSRSAVTIAPSSGRTSRRAGSAPREPPVDRAAGVDHTLEGGCAHLRLPGADTIQVVSATTVQRLTHWA